jgi:tRNA-Thr(GGU) m(6)t(6)A37 methyltransferase TsaA
MPCEPIGIIHSCFKEKFGVPRQPRLVMSAGAELELYPPFDRPEAVAELDGFSHIWVIFLFHECLEQGWKPTVRPPRLGGNRKVGVFASRSPFRPNPIGMSAVELAAILNDVTGTRLLLRGVDLLDGTPVLDIKPYVPFADSIADARAGFAKEKPRIGLRVEFTTAADLQVHLADPDGALALRTLIVELLQQDPRPAYLSDDPERTRFGMRIHDFNVRWVVRGKLARVESVLRVQA